MHDVVDGGVLSRLSVTVVLTDGTAPDRRRRTFLDALRKHNDISILTTIDH